MRGAYEESKFLINSKSTLYAIRIGAERTLKDLEIVPDIDLKINSFVRQSKKINKAQNLFSNLYLTLSKKHLSAKVFFLRIRIII